MASDGVQAGSMMLMMATHASFRTMRLALFDDAFYTKDLVLVVKNLTQCRVNTKDLSNEIAKYVLI